MACELVPNDYGNGWHLSTSTEDARMAGFDRFLKCGLLFEVQNVVNKITSFQIEHRYQLWHTRKYKEAIKLKWRKKKKKIEPKMPWNWNNATAISMLPIKLIKIAKLSINCTHFQLDIFWEKEREKNAPCFFFPLEIVWNVWLKIRHCCESFNRCESLFNFNPLIFSLNLTLSCGQSIN